MAPQSKGGQEELKQTNHQTLQQRPVLEHPKKFIVCYFVVITVQKTFVKFKVMLLAF